MKRFAFVYFEKEKSNVPRPYLYNTLLLIRTGH